MKYERNERKTRAKNKRERGTRMQNLTNENHAGGYFWPV